MGGAFSPIGVSALFTPPPLAKRRRVFFSFSYSDDINRTNVVRQSWRTHNPETVLGGPSFVDSSIWGTARQLTDDRVKDIIRDGIEQTSVTCVLVGANTWSSRWVRYEIARSVIRGNGLLVVDIHRIGDMRTLIGSSAGYNPLSFIAVGKNGAQYFLYQLSGGGWSRYLDHTNSVTKPPSILDMPDGYVRSLDAGTKHYDYKAQDGYRNLGTWVDTAAREVNR